MKFITVALVILGVCSGAAVADSNINVSGLVQGVVEVVEEELKQLSDSEKRIVLTEFRRYLDAALEGEEGVSRGSGAGGVLLPVGGEPSVEEEPEFDGVGENGLPNLRGSDGAISSSRYKNTQFSYVMRFPYPLARSKANCGWVSHSSKLVLEANCGRGR